MHKSSRQKSLVRNATAHITQAEEEHIKARAKTEGITKSEWCRQALLSCLEVPSASRLVLQEILALRKVFLVLKLDEIHSHSLTEDRLRFLIEQAETTKAAMAESRIQSMRSKDAND